MPLPWRLKKWSGSAWVDAELRRWDGSAFQVCNGYYWDGASWVLLTDRTPPTTTHNDQFDSIDRGTYNGYSGGQPTGLPNNYQGYYDGTYGIQRSLWQMDYLAASAALTGRTATYSCQIFLANNHFYFTSGYAVIGTHANTVVPPSFNAFYNRYNIATFAWARGESKWVTVTNDMAGWFAGQTMTGPTLFADTFDSTYYGYFSTFASVFFSYEK